jgi:hypothetical protein
VLFAYHYLQFEASARALNSANELLNTTRTTRGTNFVPAIVGRCDNSVCGIRICGVKPNGNHNRDCGNTTTIDKQTNKTKQKTNKQTNKQKNKESSCVRRRQDERHRLRSKAVETNVASKREHSKKETNQTEGYIESIRRRK